MSQNVFTTIEPDDSGTELATTLNNFKDALMSGLSGTSRPTALQVGGSWIDTTNAPNSWSYRVWTGTTDVEVFKIDLVTGVASVALAVDSFIVKKISADTVGAIVDLVKRRVASNGQVLDGDVVGEIRITGRTNTATNPVVAKMVWTAADDQTTTAFGGTLSFHSTPDGTATLTEHMRLINGMVETVVPLRVNSQVFVGQNVATSATIASLSATKILVEMTGSTATDIQGINATHDSKVVTIHNRSSANVTFKHENGTASAANRIKLPGSADYILQPDGTLSLYYCTADSRWKLLSTSDKISGFRTDVFYGVGQSWTAPATTSSVRVTAYRALNGMNNERSGLVDNFGNAYSWGVNTVGQLGDLSVVPKSSPVIVVGGRQFLRTWGAVGASQSAYALDLAGVAFGWGANANGQIGDNTVVPKSSPTAVVGTGRFLNLYPRDASVFGVATNNAALAWGINTNGQLGDGSVVPKSSPVSVLGGFRYSKIVPISGANTNAAVVGLSRAGIAYAWGINTNGNLGLGDVTPRSSPVAVLGGFTFQDIQGGAVSSRYFFVGLTTAGAAVAWGANTNSQLGVGDQTARSSPVAVLGGLTFRRLFVHPKSESVYGITTTGVLYAWGDNSQGQLGVGDIVNRSSPVAVLGGLTVSDVYPFRESVLAVATDGTLYGWGRNANGQLGVGDVVSRSSPVAVLGSNKYVAAFWADGPTDIYSAFGIATDGLVYAWGANANGTLGVGDVTPRSSPVAVVGSFVPDTTEYSMTVDLTVTGGQSYTVNTGPLASFGHTPLGRDVYRVEVQYLS